MLENVAGFFSGDSSGFITEDGRPAPLFVRQPTRFLTDYAGLTLPRRIAVTPPDSFLQSGMMLIDPFGIRYILGSWPSDSFRGQLVARQFVLMECNAQLSWSRPTHEIDPISELTRTGGTQVLGDLWVVTERRNLETSAGNFDSHLRRIICVADIQPGDTLGEHIAKYVERTQGFVVVDVA